MDKNLLVFGDSYLYGNGLQDCGYDLPWEQHSKSTWPYHVFTSHDIVNHAHAGCSNDMISLRLVRHAVKGGEVVIMFTYPQRLHTITKGYNFCVGNQFTTTITDNGKENFVALQIKDQHEQQHRDLLINNYEDQMFEILFLKDILFCQNFCDSNNIKYHFTVLTAPEKSRARGSVEKYRDGLWDQIDWDKIFLVEGKYGFTDYAKMINAQPGLDGVHLNQEYHELFGKLFLDWINKEKVL
jgi:hypothetical protein